MSRREMDQRAQEPNLDSRVARCDRAQRSEKWKEGCPSDITAIRSSSRGADLEYFVWDREALLVYEEALTSSQDERVALETHRLLDRIGVSALDLDDGPRAFAAFVDAGRRAKDDGMRRLCAEALAAAGWSLATHPLARPIAGIVDRDLVTAGFDGVIEEAREVLLVDGRPNYGRASAVQSRFAGLMVLSAEALLEEASSSAAKNLSDDVLTPFLALHDVFGRTTADPSVVTASQTRALARLCRALGEQGSQRRMGASATRDAVAEMARHVSNAFVWEARESMRWWIGSYLRRHRGTDWTKDDHLLAAGHDRSRRCEHGVAGGQPSAGIDSSRMGRSGPGRSNALSLARYDVDILMSHRQTGSRTPDERSTPS